MRKLTNFNAHNMVEFCFTKFYIFNSIKPLNSSSIVLLLTFKSHLNGSRTSPLNKSKNLKINGININGTLNTQKSKFCQRVTHLLVTNIYLFAVFQAFLFTDIYKTLPLNVVAKWFEAELGASRGQRLDDSGRRRRKKTISLYSRLVDLITAFTDQDDYHAFNTKKSLTYP